jgi:adenylosuccinate synthase
MTAIFDGDIFDHEEAQEETEGETQEEPEEEAQEVAQEEAEEEESEEESSIHSDDSAVPPSESSYYMRAAVHVSDKMDKEAWRQATSGLTQEEAELVDRVYRVTPEEADLITRVSAKADRIHKELMQQWVERHRQCRDDLEEQEQAAKRQRLSL